MRPSFIFYLLQTFFCTLSTHSFAQEASTPCRVISLPPPESLNALTDEEHFEKSFRFGIEIKLDTTLTFAPFQCLGFHIPGAVSLSVNFGPASLEGGDTLLVLNERFGSAQTFPGRLWKRKNHIWPASLPVYGSTFYLKLQSAGSARVNINSIVYGFRDWQCGQKGFGDSGPCNNNVNCGYDEWTNEKRSVVMLLTAGNTRKCSGVLLNTTAHDGRPYLLTARHCSVQSNSIFLFNYESPGCEVEDGPLSQVIQGCTVLSSYAPSDFTLVELSEPPPPEYHPFYAGWNRTLYLPSQGVTCIHHPRGDVKKISFDNQNPTPAPYISSADTTRNHWHIQEWDSGTTEPVSSGSPLFDALHRVIGQLHGGQASCNFNFNDYYGTLFHSWTGGGTPATSLQPWLDPLNTGAEAIPGFDPNHPLWAYDAGFVSNHQNVTVCEESPHISLRIRNYGHETLQSVRLKRLGKSGIIEVWDTLFSIPYGKIFTWPLHIWSLKSGQSVHEIFVVELSGDQPDQNPNNDTLFLTLKRIWGETIMLRLFTDLFPSELNGWLVGDNGDTLWELPPLTPSDMEEWTLCLPYGCYTLRLNDSGGDGLCCEYGQGFAELRDHRGLLMGRVDQFASEASVSFCIPFIPEAQQPVLVAPVPARDLIWITVPPDWAGAEAYWRIVGSAGQTLLEGTGLQYFNTFDVGRLAAGVYYFSVNKGENRGGRKFIKL
ncbi:MAG: hypothetical protein N2110_08840 [Flavobacteriales bacterium]|nr:hypothetical protein [Flavobacteriales bacterium]